MSAWTFKGPPAGDGRALAGDCGLLAELAAGCDGWLPAAASHIALAAR